MQQIIDEIYRLISENKFTPKLYKLTILKLEGVIASNEGLSDYLRVRTESLLLRLYLILEAYEEAVTLARRIDTDKKIAILYFGLELLENIPAIPEQNLAVYYQVYGGKDLSTATLYIDPDHEYNSSHSKYEFQSVSQDVQSIAQDNDRKIPDEIMSQAKEFTDHLQRIIESTEKDIPIKHLLPLANNIQAYNQELQPHFTEFFLTFQNRIVFSKTKMRPKPNEIQGNPFTYYGRTQEISIFLNPHIQKILKTHSWLIPSIVATGHIEFINSLYTVFLDDKNTFINELLDPFLQILLGPSIGYISNPYNGTKGWIDPVRVINCGFYYYLAELINEGLPLEILAKIEKIVPRLNYFGKSDLPKMFCVLLLKVYFKEDVRWNQNSQMPGEKFLSFYYNNITVKGLQADTYVISRKAYFMLSRLPSDPYQAQETLTIKDLEILQDYFDQTLEKTDKVSIQEFRQLVEAKLSECLQKLHCYDVEVATHLLKLVHIIYVQKSLNKDYLSAKAKDIKFSLYEAEYSNQAILQSIYQYWKKSYNPASERRPLNNSFYGKVVPKSLTFFEFFTTMLNTINTSESNNLLHEILIENNAIAQQAGPK